MSINKLILKELEKVQVAKVGEYDYCRRCFTITKYQPPSFSMNGLYIVELDSHLLNATDNEVLVCNWNAGRYPTQKYMKIKITKTLGKMMYVYGVYYDVNTQTELDEDWDGWLPTEQVKILREV